MKSISYIELGGTLFIPATHKDLNSVVNGDKYENLRSVVVDTEDGVSDYDLPHAVRCVKNMLTVLDTSSVKTILNVLDKRSVLVFVRPKNIKVLKELLRCKHIDRIDGFVLPKFSLDNADAYLKLLKNKPYCFMPSIEGSELFDPKKLLELKNKLVPHKEKIILVRFGLEDMLGQLKMRRDCKNSIFDYSTTNFILGNFLAVFKSEGFEVSGGVYPCFKDDEGFRKDVLRDLREGLFSKTIIHPNQIDITNELYKVSQEEYEEAKAILLSTNAIFNYNSKMTETTTMHPHAQSIVKRAETYNVSL